MVKKIKSDVRKRCRHRSHVTPSMVNSNASPISESGTTTVLQERASEFSISLHDREERVPLDLGMFECAACICSQMVVVTPVQTRQQSWLQKPERRSITILAGTFLRGEKHFTE